MTCSCTSDGIDGHVIRDAVVLQPVRNCAGCAMKMDSSGIERPDRLRLDRRHWRTIISVLRLRMFIHFQGGRTMMRIVPVAAVAALFSASFAISSATAQTPTPGCGPV